jgi:hypothetical protein
VFFCAGYAFWELLYDGVTFTGTQRGTINADTQRATIAANGIGGRQLFITSGGTGYCYDLQTNTLTPVGVPATTVTMGASIDGFFVYLDATTGTLYNSALYDGTSWSALNSQRSAASDPWVAMCVTPDRLIHCFGESTKEALHNAGLPGFPFSIIPEANMPFGISAPYAFTVDQSVTWLAQTKKGRGQVVVAQGYTPTRVSNHGIETTIQGYATISDTTACSYQQHGNTHAIFTFPTADASWAVDGATGTWHQRGYWNTTTGAYQAWRPGFALAAFGRLLVGDRQTGSIYTLATDTFTDVDGALIRRVRQPPPLTFDGKRFTVDGLRVVMDVGVGLPTGQGIDPQAMLKVSRNGGKTFGNEHWTTLGALGTFNTRVLWSQLGQARSFVPQVVVSDPVAARITDASADVRVGAS